MWAISLALCKLSLCLLYSKVFSIAWIVAAARINSVVVILWCLGTILSTLLVCQPIEFNWDTSIEGGHCGDQLTMFKITGVLNLVTDIATLVLPLRCLWNLQMSRYKKITLMTVFSLGFV